MSKKIDLMGQTFGKWTVIATAPSTPAGKTRWVCHCLCGTQRAINAGALKNGQTTKCCFCAGIKREKPTIAAIKEQYINLKKSVMAMATMYGVSRGCVEKWLNNAGVKRRSLSEAAILSLKNPVILAKRLKALSVARESENSRRYMQSDENIRRLVSMRAWRKSNKSRMEKACVWHTCPVCSDRFQTKRRFLHSGQKHYCSWGCCVIGRRRTQDENIALRKHWLTRALAAQNESNSGAA